MKNVRSLLKKATAIAAASTVISSFGIVSYADDKTDYIHLSNEEVFESGTYSDDENASEESAVTAPDSDNTESYAGADNAGESEVFLGDVKIIAVSGTNLAPNIDNGEQLQFSIENITNTSVTFMTNPTNGEIQKLNEKNEWVNIEGEHGNAPSFDNLSPEDIYLNSVKLNIGSKIDCSMSVSFLRSGSYRMKLYMFSEFGYAEEYVFFSVSENVSMESDTVIYTNDPKYNFSVTNTLPNNISAQFSDDLTLERLEDGEWVDSEISFDNLTEKMTVKSGKICKMHLSFNGISKFVPGEYKLTLVLSTDTPAAKSITIPVSKTMTAYFTVLDPVTASVMSATVTGKDKIYVPLKVVNNTNETITVEDYGRITRNSNNRWVDLSYKNGAKDFDEKTEIEPGEEKIIKIKMSDFYRTGRLSIGVPYKMTYTAGGKEYDVYFKLAEGIIRTDSNNRDTDEYYYIIKEYDPEEDE